VNSCKLFWMHFRDRQMPIADSVPLFHFPWLVRSLKQLIVLIGGVPVSRVAKAYPNQCAEKFWHSSWFFRSQPCQWRIWPIQWNHITYSFGEKVWCRHSTRLWYKFRRRNKISPKTWHWDSNRRPPPSKNTAACWMLRRQSPSGW
jgi:hypothetical protein